MSMRDLTALDAHRMRGPRIVQIFGSEGDAGCGAFMLASALDGGMLRIVAADGMGWDHVSVSREDRCPRWEEMEQVKRLFFRDTEVAMQLHVPVADHISHHANCLHLWRPQVGAIPLPPSLMVAPRPG